MDGHSACRSKNIIFTSPVSASSKQLQCVNDSMWHWQWHWHLSWERINFLNLNFINLNFRLSIFKILCSTTRVIYILGEQVQLLQWVVFCQVNGMQEVTIVILYFCICNKVVLSKVTTLYFVKYCVTIFPCLVSRDQIAMSKYINSINCMQSYRFLYF